MHNEDYNCKEVRLIKATLTIKVGFVDKNQSSGRRKAVGGVFVTN